MKSKPGLVIFFTLIIVTLGYVFTFNPMELDSVAKNDPHQKTNLSKRSQNQVNQSTSGEEEPLQEPSTPTLPQINHERTDELSAQTGNAINTEHTEQSVESFDELVNEKDGKLYFDTSPIMQMDKTQVDWLLSSLPINMTQNRSMQIMETLSQEVANYSAQSNVIFTNDVQCSDMICGLIFESNDRSSIQSALSDLSSTNAFSKNTRGGTLRVLEEHGTYYGIIISPITESSISLR